MKEKKKLVLFGIGGMICLFLIIGISYAVWQLNLSQTNENVLTTGCFKINFTEKNDIQLNNAYPIVDEAGKKLVPYELTLENTCETPASYQVNLEILDSTTLMNYEYIKIMYDEKNPRILTNYNETQKTLDNATTSYKLDTGFLEGNTSKTFTVRLWMDEDTPPTDEVMNKIFKSKITITSVYEEKMPGTLRIVYSSDSSGMWSYRENITKLVIQDMLQEIPNAIAINDESDSQDGSIMSYVVLNEDGTTYTAYLQGNKKIYLNPDSSYLFYFFKRLESIDGIEIFDTSNVTSMQSMFYRCSNLTTLAVTNFITSNVKEMQLMFNNCQLLTGLDLSSFDTSKVTNMNAMFGGCISLETVNLSTFQTSLVKDMSNMFSDCNSLVRLDLKNFNTSNVTNMSNMFFKCYALNEVNLLSFDTKNVKEMQLMFNNCKSIIDLNLSSFNTSSVTNMNAMFGGCISLETVNLSTFQTSLVKDMSNMFSDCSSLNNLDLSSFQTINVTNMDGMFSSCSNMTSLYLGETFNTSSVTNMASMFKDCRSLSSLDLSQFDTRNVTTMWAMFSGCNGLTSLNVTSFNTSQVEYMVNMFFQCTNLTSLDLSSFDTSKVTNMYYMFSGNNNLTSIVYSASFIHKEDANIEGMFINCPANKPTHESWNGVTF